MRACGNIEMLIPLELSDGGLLTWETAVRKGTSSHTDLWANKL